jgi:hypothetical protein
VNGCPAVARKTRLEDFLGGMESTGSALMRSSIPSAYMTIVLSGLLRAQFASDFLGPGHAANSWPIRAQSSKSPVHPDDGGKQQWLSK